MKIILPNIEKELMNSANHLEGSVAERQTKLREQISNSIATGGFKSMSDRGDVKDLLEVFKTKNASIMLAIHRTWRNRHWQKIEISTSVINNETKTAFSNLKLFLTESGYTVLEEP